MMEKNNTPLIWMQCPSSKNRSNGELCLNKHLLNKLLNDYTTPTFDKLYIKLRKAQVDPEGNILQDSQGDALLETISNKNHITFFEVGIIGNESEKPI